MVNRLWPLKWVGFSNNQGYKNVRNAAKVYANVLNKYPLPARTPAVITEINRAKSNLQLKINKYLENIPVAPGASPAAAPAPLRYGPAPPAGGPVANSRAPITGNWPNGTYKPGNVDGKRTSVYKMGTDYYYLFSTNNGRETWVKVKRDGNSNSYSLNRTNGKHKYYVKTRNANGRAVFTPMGNANAAAAAAPSGANRLAFGKFMMLAPSLGRTTPQNQAKNYLNGRNSYKNNFGPVNFSAVRRITRNTNVNAATRAEFWNAVNAEKAGRGPPIPKNLAKFKAWYATQGGLPNKNRGITYVTIMKGNNRNRKIEVGGVMRGNNTNTNTVARNNRARAGGFWNAVNAEMARRAATA